MSFKHLCTAAAVVSFTLCVTLIAAPQILYWLFSLSGNALGDFMAKRAGVLFLGLATLCVLARGSADFEIQRIVSAALGVTMAGLAVLGTVEFARGTAGAGMMLAVAIEAGFAALYLQCWIKAAPARTRA